MDNLKDQIIEAVRRNDKEQLKELREKLKLVRWLNQFEGNVPIAAWLENDSPIVRFK